MIEQQKLSRREWFRLRAPRKNATLGRDALNANGSILKPIGQPPNHDGLDLKKLPPMREAMLTWQDMDSLFTDIEQLASDVTFMQRGNNNARAYASLIDTSNRFEMARFALVTGRTKRMQIRYRWGDSLWIDTLEQQASGFRLVRIAHQEA